MPTHRFSPLLLAAGLGVALVFTLSALRNDVVADRATVPPGLHLRGQDAQGLELELITTALTETTRVHAGVVYQQLDAPGAVQMGRPGEPALPGRAVLLGVPTTAGLQVTVLGADTATRGGYHLYPVPAHLPTAEVGPNLAGGAVRETFVRDADAYAHDAFAPAELAIIATAGYVRDQAVVQLQLNPVQYNPARGEIRIIERLRVRVTWDEAAVAAAPAADRGASPAFEPLLARVIFNYQSLDRPATAWHGTVEGRDFAPAPAAVAASDPTLKIGVSADALYRLTYDELAGAGLSVDVLNPQNLQLHDGSGELPIAVVGEGDGSFDPGDLVLFYGRAVANEYTVTNVYWLSVGAGPGLRMSRPSGAPGGAAVPTSFPESVHAEEDSFYWVTMPDGAGEDHWFWGDRISPSTGGLPTSRAYTLTVENLHGGAADATLRARLKGYTALAHRTKLYVNGVAVDDQTWAGTTIFEHSVTFAASLLVEGANTITVEAADAGAVVDQSLVNWLELDYEDTFVAEGDRLPFGPPAAGTHRFRLTDFTTDDAEVFDIGDPTALRWFDNTSIAPDGGGFRLEFQTATGAGDRFLALTPAQYGVVDSIVADTPSSWQSPANSADYIIITHEDFLAPAQTLATHRGAGGLDVEIVLVEDIYDEFNAGVFNPAAIRDFLAYAYANWQAPAPTYVLFLGGASYDYRDLLGLNRSNYVPTQMVETATLGQTPSDNWLASIVGGDVLPDLLAGRLTAQNVADATDMVNKVINYELSPPPATWNNQTLLVADDNDVDFEELNDDLAALLPHYYQNTKVYAADYPPGDPAVDITNKIESGALLLNYSGHGNVSIWGNWAGGRIYGLSDVNALANTNRLPVVTVANCLNGYFNGQTTSLAEGFLERAAEGGIAVFAPSGLGIPSGHRAVLTAFYEAIYQDDLYEMGASTTAAKLDAFAQSSQWGELLETFNLFGDPALPLGLPPNPPYLTAALPNDGATNVFVNTSVLVNFSKPVDPAATSLVDDQGTSYTPSWNAAQTAVTFSHAAYPVDTTIQLTLSAADALGNPLGAGPIPSTWSFTTEPDNIEVLSFTAQVNGANAVDLAWSTGVENNNLGFNIWRATSAGGTYIRLNVALIPSQGGFANYTYGDDPGPGTFYYNLEDVDVWGGTTMTGPVGVTVPGTPVFRVYSPVLTKK